MVLAGLGNGGACRGVAEAVDYVWVFN